MKAFISKSEIRGKVKAPSSKSYTIRGLMCAALADGESQILYPLSSDDTEAAWRVLSQAGIRLESQCDTWLVNGGNFRRPGGDLFCSDSAATLRFMTAIAALIPGSCRLTAGPSLSRRPVGTLIDALTQLGVKCSAPGGLPPVMVESGLKGGLAELPGDISSQYVSALLLVSPLAEDDVKISLTTPLESKPYVLMTLECLEKFGVKVQADKDLREFVTRRQKYQPARYVVEGDWSSASYLLALGAVAGEIEVENLNPASLQGDKAIIDFLKQMGASIHVRPQSIIIKKAPLQAIKADLNDCIDLLPTMAVLAAAAEGTSEFTGVERARLKESDRIAAVKTGLEAMGVRVIEEQNKLTITGTKPKGAVIDTFADHRMAMAFSILGTLAGDTVLKKAECVSKTYPGYWSILDSIGGKVKLDG